MVGRGQGTGNPSCHPRETVSGSHSMAAHWGHVLPPALRVCGSNAVIPSLSHLFTFCLCYAQLHDKPQIGEVPRELIQVISFMSCIDRKCFLTGSHEKPWEHLTLTGQLWSPAVAGGDSGRLTARVRPCLSARTCQGAGWPASPMHWFVHQCETAISTTCRYFFCFWECELPGSNIHSLSGYLIRWKFLRVQPINASIALVTRQSSFLKGFYNNQVKKKNDFLFWFAINMLS